MNDFDWTLLQSFLAVAEHGSYSAAARATGRSQPTIGRHIDTLQSQLGAILFQRDLRGYVLTDTGQALLEHANAMRDAAGRISLIADGQADAVTGTVRVTASKIVATYHLPAVIADLLTQEPGLQIELVASDSTQNLLRREADVAVRMVDPTQPDLIARKVGELALGVYAAPAYVARNGLPKELGDLRDHVLLGYDQSDLILDGMRAFGLDIQRDDFAFRCDDQVTFFEALCAGVGLGPTQTALAHRAGLINVFPDIKIPPLPVWLAAHAELRTSARVRRVFDHLAQHLPETLR